MNLTRSEIAAIERALSIVARLKGATKKRARFAAGGEAEGEGDAEGDGEGAQTEGGDPSGGDPAAGDSPDSGEGGGPASGGPEPSGAQSDAGAQQQEGQQQEADSAGAAQAAAAAAAAATQDDTTQAPGVSAAGALGGYSNVSRDNRAGGFGFGDFSGGFAGMGPSTVGPEPDDVGSVVPGGAGVGLGVSGAALSAAGAGGVTGGLAGFDNMGANIGAGLGPSSVASPGFSAGYDPGDRGPSLPEGYGVAPGYGAGTGRAATVNDDGVMDRGGFVNLNVPVGDLVDRGRTEPGLPSANPGRNGWAGPGATSDPGPWDGTSTRDNVVGRAMGVREAMVNAGLPEPGLSGIAGVLGNLSFESGGNRQSPTGIDFGAHNPAGGNFGAMGAAGWRGGRAENLAERAGIPQETMQGLRGGLSGARADVQNALRGAVNAQFEQIADELANPAKQGMGSPVNAARVAGLIATLANSNSTPAQAAASFMDTFERPGRVDQQTSVGARGRAAQNFSDAFRDAAFDYGIAANLAASRPAVVGGLQYNAPAGLGVFSGATPAAAMAQAAAARGASPAQAAAPAAASPATAAANEIAGERSSGTAQGRATGPAQADQQEPPAEPAVSPAVSAAAALGGLATVAMPDRVGWANLPADSFIDEGGMGVTGRGLGRVATGVAGTSMNTNYPGSRTASLAGFDQFGANFDAGLVPSTTAAARQDQMVANAARAASHPGISPGSLATTGPNIEQVAPAPAMVSRAAGRVGSQLAGAALGAVVPGLGLANLASGLLGGPTIGGKIGEFLAGQDPALNTAVAGKIADAHKGNGGADWITPAAAKSAEAAPAAAKSAEAAPAAAAATTTAQSTQTPADLAYLAAMAFRPAGVRVGVKPTPAQVVTSGLVQRPQSAAERLANSLYYTA